MHVLERPSQSPDLNKSLQTFDLQELQIKFLGLVGNYFFSTRDQLGLYRFISLNKLNHYYYYSFTKCIFYLLRLSFV